MKKFFIYLVLILFILFLTYLFLYENKVSLSEDNKVSLSEDNKVNLSEDNKNKNIPVLMYLHLEDGINNTGTIDPDRFREHMEYLNRDGYETITDYDLLSYLEGEVTLPEKPILITFDDGYKSNYDYAYPILKELDMKATINVIVSRMFEKESESIYKNEMPKFTWEDAREMKGTILIQGHTFDSHSKEVGMFGKKRGLISERLNVDGNLETQHEFESRVYNDLIKSKEIIEEKMGYEVVSIAYPFGEYSKDTIELAKKAGYKMGFVVRKGKVNPDKDNFFELKRITGDGSLTGEELLEEIKTIK